jgi:hypothetical protein
MFDVKAELRTAGINRIFEEFFDDAGGPFNHFSSRDFVGDQIGEDANAAHFLEESEDRSQ